MVMSATSGGYSQAGQSHTAPTCQSKDIGLPSLFLRTPSANFYVTGGKHVSRTRIAIGISTAVGVAAALGVMAAPTAGAQARAHHTPSSGFKVIASHLNNP